MTALRYMSRATRPKAYREYREYSPEDIRKVYLARVERLTENCSVHIHFLEFSCAQSLRDQHLIPPGSCFDATGRGKWCYKMADAETCEPYPLPASALRHGMSWAEWD